MPKKILAVDNHPLILEVISSFLEKEGHEVRVAHDGLSALGVLEEGFVPDIMFVDLVMPNISGDKLCRIVRSMPHLQEVFIVILSAIAREGEMDFLSYGADACIAKGSVKNIFLHVQELIANCQRRTISEPESRILGIEGIYQREVTKELLRSQKNLELVLDHMSEGVIHFTQTQKIIYVNAKAVDLFGQPEEKLLGADFFSGLFQEPYASELRTLVESVNQHPLWVGEEETIFVGKKRLLLGFLSIPDDESGTILALVCDITKRKEDEAQMREHGAHLSKLVAERTISLTETNLQLHKEIAERAKVEKSLARAHQRLLTVLDSLDAIIYVVNMHSYEILFMNRHAREIFGEGAGRICWTVMQCGQDGPCSFCSTEKVLAANGVKRGRGGVYVWENQNTVTGRWYEHHDRAIKWMGDIRAKISIGTDITERKNEEAREREARELLEQRVSQRTAELEKIHRQLLHAEKLNAVGKLAASIAHEFNNPICGILNVLDGLKRRAIFGGEDLQMVDLAIRECGRIARLTKDLQSFNRPTSGIEVQVDVHAALEDILLLCRKDMKNKHISLVKDFAPSLPGIQAVEDQIKQVFLNLLTNAEEAITGESGIITVRTEKRDGYVAVQFQDSGHGIAPEDQEKIFEPFFSTKSAAKGTGLGLSVSYGIVTRHGGTIEVESALGVGTTFTVLLPVEGRA